MAGISTLFVVRPLKKALFKRNLYALTMREELIYFSCAPWFEITAFTNENYLDGNGGAADNSIPRIAWENMQDDGERKVLHISVEVNHRFIDGIHIGRFHQKLTGLIDALQIN